ncbi:acetylxylan esterase [Methanolobus zinderi]|uniref:Acetylxylan esterase n=1 Tax=Methanolobus zinderi TaxID=536044 RepID=A0A7D5HZZ3_9EURY|nr:acetylxylan esterase [Methanolobus zinderi]QLC49366.1 acetylxylan esterase [Methanolobus zinderi]
MSKKQNSKKKNSSTDQNIRKRRIVMVLGVLLIVAGFLGIDLNPEDDDGWTVSDEGILSYARMEEIQYSYEELNGNTTDTLKLITFESRGAQIEGILRIPQSDTRVPGVVLLPGAGVTKEMQNRVPETLAELGYASFTIDQRNLGGINPESDLELFKKGEEPLEYLMVYDAMMAADVLQDQARVEDNIAMLGLSNGGRFAIIATAIDPDIKGVIAISTGGYDTDSIDRNMVADETAYRFYTSIDPDNYLDMIPPRRLVMFHSVNDSIVPYEMAHKTFSKAEEPKAFYGLTGDTHGYSHAAEGYLEKELDLIFN